MKKSQQFAVAPGVNGETCGNNCSDLAVAVHRALKPADEQLGRYLLLLALSGSLTAVAGCGSAPLIRSADDPSFVVAMVADQPERHRGTATFELPVPEEPLPEQLVDRRPEALPPESEVEQDYIENTEPPHPESLPESEVRPAFESVVESEVVGFRLNGTRSWQRLNILDMDVVQDSENERYLPLLRVLRILEIEHSADSAVASFHLPGEPEIRIEFAAASAWLGDREIQLKLLTGISDITGRSEVYVSASDLQRLLPIHLAWDDINYEFKGTTNSVFAIWERRTNEHSLLFANANLIGMDLPSLLGIAEPSQNKLSFMELQWGSRLSTGQNRDSDMTLGGAPTVWGNVLGGRYKISLSDAEVSTSQSSSRSNNFVPRQAEWTRSNAKSELVLGDSAFGLHDLAFPLANFSGVRINGLLGSATEAESDVSARGLHRRFYRPHVFEGYAPVGSEVRLEMNGTVIATQRVLEETDPVSGTGIFRFDDIALSTNSLSNIKAVITDSDGVETEIERDLVGAPQLLPAGRLSYVGGMGINRTRRDWDGTGSLSAGRLLYGLSDRLSIGTSLAFQNQFYDLTNITDGNDRLYPDSSGHAVAEFIALPLSNVTLSGDIALSKGSDGLENTNHDGTAYRVRTRYFPTDTMQFGSQWFHYAPGYFDGRNRELENKTGYSVDGQWRPWAKWSVRGAIGAANQLEGSRFRGRRSASYGQLALTTTALPRTSLTVKFDQNDLSWEKPKTLTTLRTRTRFHNGFDLRIDSAFGDQLSPQGDQDYFQGLNLPGFSRIGSDNRFLSLDKQLNSIHRVGIEYRNTRQTEKIYAVHAFETPRLRMSSKLGYEIQEDQPVWEGWWDYPFKERGRDRLSLVTRYERGEWRADLSLNVVSLFENDRGSFGRVPGDRFNPDRGGVKGRVFVDLNGNGVLDQGERGMPNIEVQGQGNVRASTNDDGRFYLPVSVTNKQMRVALNVDTIPATYSVVHGKQTAAIGPGGATEVNLAVTPLVAVSGSILLQIEEPDDAAVAEYRRKLAAELDIDINTEPVAGFDTDNVVVLSQATRINPQQPDAVLDVTPRNEELLSAEVPQTSLVPDASIVDSQAVAKSPDEFVEVFPAINIPVQAQVADVATPALRDQLVYEDQFVEVFPAIDIPVSTQVAEVATEPELAPALPDEPVYEDQFVEVLPAIDIPVPVQVAEVATEPEVIPALPDEPVYEDQFVEVLPAIDIPVPVQVAEVATEPEVIPALPDEPVYEDQFVEVFPAIDIPVPVQVAEVATEPEVIPALPDEPVYEDQFIEVLPAIDIPVPTQVAEVATGPEVIPALPEEPLYEDQFAEVLPAIKIPVPVQVAEVATGPEVIPALPDEPVYEDQFIEVLPAIDIPVPVQVAEVATEPELAPALPDEPVYEDQFVEVFPAIEIPVPTQVAEVATEPELAPALPDEPVYEDQFVEVLPAIEIPVPTQVAEVATEPELAPALPDEPVYEDQFVEVLPAIEIPVPAQVADTATETPAGPAPRTAAVDDLSGDPEIELSVARTIEPEELEDWETALTVPQLSTDHLEESLLAETPRDEEAGEALVQSPQEPEPEIVETIPLEQPMVAEVAAEAEPVAKEPASEIVETIPLEEPVLAEAVPEFRPATEEPKQNIAETFPLKGPVVVNAVPKPGPVVDEPELEVAETIPLEEVVLAEATPEPEPVIEELEIVETIPLEEPVLAEAAPAPEPVTEELEIVETIPLEEPVLAEAAPAPEPVTEELEIVETILLEEVVLAEAAPEPEPVVEELEIVETIPLQEAVLADAAPEPEPVIEELEIVETIPLQEVVLAEAAPEPDPVVEELEIVETIPLEEVVLAQATPEPEPVVEEPEIVETIPLEEVVLAEAAPEPEPVVEELEIVETIPLEEVVLAQATPEPEPVVEEPEIVETIPLEEVVLAEAAPELEPVVEELEIVETVPLAEPVLAEAVPEPEPVVEEPEIVETIPLEEVVLAEAAPEPEPVAEELEIVETVPLEEVVLAEAAPEPEPVAEELEIVETIPLEEVVLAEAAPEPEPVADELEIVETIPLEEVVLAEAAPEPEPVAEELEIVETIPPEVPVLAEADADELPEILLTDSELATNADAGNDKADVGGLKLARELGDLADQTGRMEADKAFVAELEIARTLEHAETVTASPRLAQAVTMHRQTLLEMSTTLAYEVATSPDQVERQNPPLHLAMSTHIDNPPINSTPNVRFAASDDQQEQLDSQEPETPSGLRLSRMLEADTGKISPQPETPAEPVSLRMAQTLATPPENEPAKVTPIEKAMARAQDDKARASGMKLSRALNLQKHLLDKKAVSGVRVVMRDANNQVVADSVTAGDGSFYLSNLRPGSYTLEVDPKTIPEGYIVLEMSKTIEIFQGEEFQEIEIPPIYAVADLERAILK